MRPSNGFDNAGVHGQWPSERASNPLLPAVCAPASPEWPLYVIWKNNFTENKIMEKNYYFTENNKK
jgi:hypothetical protein